MPSKKRSTTPETPSAKPKTPRKTARKATPIPPAGPEKTATSAKATRQEKIATPPPAEPPVSTSAPAEPAAAAQAEATTVAKPDTAGRATPTRKGPRTKTAGAPPKRQSAIQPEKQSASTSQPRSHVEQPLEETVGPLRVLMVVPEAHPFAKTGGLAEVAAALPSALVRSGHHATLVLPRYQGINVEGWRSQPFEFPLGSRLVRGEFHENRMPDGVHAVLVDVPALYDRPGLYGADGRDYPDNAYRFAVLSRAALEYARAKGERPDIIHAHDWQTGLVPVYQKMLFSDDPVVGGVPAVFTLHNLAFQGVYSPGTLAEIGLEWNVYHPDGMEYWGNISYLKGGVNFSERLTTVSPTYAREITTPEYGFGFEGVLARRAADLIGIRNGIDVERWSPETDPFIGASYSAENLAGKREVKRQLLRAVDLPADEAALERPLIGLISRLTDQKGFDLIGASAGELMRLDAAWVMLGSGERQYEDLWRVMAERHPDRVSATIGFDERLAHLIEAGADMFLMPSRFEPCGLNQQYSLRYGTIPIVRATGGLEDTVVDADQPGGNGVKFMHYTREGLLWAVRRALDLYKNRTRWEALQRAGMAVDASWDVSAREYVKVYRSGRS